MHPKACNLLRQIFSKTIAQHAAAHRSIVYLDESGFAQSMPRTHGYSPKGARCYGLHDWNAKGRINAIGAIIKNTFLTLTLVTGSVNADVFHAWVEQDLLPKVPSGTVLVMDNASFHKRSDTIKLIEKTGCIIEWLPPYSPDLNPIEHKWAEVKSIRRKERCSVDELFTKHTNYAKLF